MGNSHEWNPPATKTFQPAIAFASFLWAFEVRYCFSKTWNLHCWTCSCAVNYDISKQLTQKWESSQGPLLHPKARGENPQHKPEHNYQTLKWDMMKPGGQTPEPGGCSCHLPGPWSPPGKSLWYFLVPVTTHHNIICIQLPETYLFSDKKILICVQGLQMASLSFYLYKNGIFLSFFTF